MKTWRDFNVREIRDVFWKTFKGKKTDAELEVLFPEMMEDAVKELDVRIACLSCGRRYPLNNLDHECLSEDVWLNGYIRNSVRDGLDKRTANKLRKKYPLKHRGERIFRGINFRTKREYEKFMGSLREEKVEFPRISSWTTNFDYARHFARCVQNGTGIEETKRKRVLRQMIREGSNMTGYKGIVVYTRARVKNTLCDISGEKLANFQEGEIILLPGDYKIYIAEIVNRVEGKTVWSNEIREFVGLR